VTWHASCCKTLKSGLYTRLMYGLTGYACLLVLVRVLVLPLTTCFRAILIQKSKGLLQAKPTSTTPIAYRLR
jgi:hypothetical protein